MLPAHEKFQMPKNSLKSFSKVSQKSLRIRPPPGEKLRNDFLSGVGAQLVLGPGVCRPSAQFKDRANNRKTPTEAVRFGTSPRQFSQPHGEQAAAEGEGDTAFEDRAACRCREELRHAGVPSGPHRCNRRVR